MTAVRRTILIERTLSSLGKSADEVADMIADFRSALHDLQELRWKPRSLEVLYLANFPLPKTPRITLIDLEIGFYAWRRYLKLSAWVALLRRMEEGRCTCATKSCGMYRQLPFEDKDPLDLDVRSLVTDVPLFDRDVALQHPTLEGHACMEVSASTSHCAMEM